MKVDRFIQTFLRLKQRSNRNAIRNELEVNQQKTCGGIKNFLKNFLSNDFTHA